MSDVSDRLVGRDPELGLLSAKIGAATAGEPGFIALSGEPGIGKTRLLAELADAASEREMLALQGSAAEFERDLPFGLLVDALDAYLEALDPAAFERLATDRLGELAGVFPSLRALGTSLDQPTTASERFRVHGAIRELLERLAARAPVLLTLDDLHWADGASLEFVMHVLRRPPQAAVTIAVTFRSGRVDADVLRELERAVRRGDADQVELGPLGADDAAALIGGNRADHERLYAAAGGNPFYLLELARAAPGDVAVSAIRLNGGVPAAVATAIRDELDRLSEPTRAFAEAASVAGDPFEIEIAAAAAGVDESEALVAIDELAASALLRADHVPRRFRFRHPLVRSAIYESSAPGTRLAAHRRSAATLAERGAPARVRAHHAEHGASHGDRAAIEVLREAAQETSQQAPASAARWFAAALRLLPTDADPIERLELLTSQAGSDAAIGRFEEARAAMLAAIELVPPDDQMLRIRLTAGCAGIDQLLGRHAEAHRRLVAALEQIRDRDSTEAVSLMLALADDGFYRGDYAGMYEWARRAAEALERSADEGLRPAALAVLAMAAAFAGEIEVAEEACDESAKLVDALTDEELAPQLNTIGHLGGAELYLDRYERAAAHSGRGLAIARATAQGEMVPVLYPSYSTSTWVLGRTGESREALDGAVEAARLSRNVQALSWTLFNRCLVALMVGDVEVALASGEESLALTSEFDNGLISAWAAVNLAATLVEAGRCDGVAELILEHAGGEELGAIPGGWRAWAFEVLARAHMALGREVEARRAVERAERVADETGLRHPRLMADRAAAVVALACGELEVASERAVAAARIAEEIDTRVDGAFARLLAGRALAASGERDRAIAELERAAAEFEACEAPRYRDQAEQELGKLGRRVHRRSRPGRPGAQGIDALTGRELEVARLVAAGRTNKAIAAELFLSIKTVESHLRNIFGKLDVSSRVGVATAVERADSIA
jgi:ATP/maltotriose-dependent transcriptional regulator MalT